MDTVYAVLIVTALIVLGVYCTYLAVDLWRKSREDMPVMRTEAFRPDPMMPGVMQHRGGVVWHQAPMPRRWHRCWVQTKGVMLTDRTPIERCACGAIRKGERAADPWIKRNERRRGRR